MRTPTEYELQHLLTGIYDPLKAHEYYERTKKLKGRQRGSTSSPTSRRSGSSQDPRTGFTREQIHLQAKARQRGEIKAAIGRMEKKLKAVEALLRKKEHEAAAEDRKGKAKKERAAKDRDKPKTAAEKAEAARDSKKYRDKNQQKLDSKANEASTKSGGGKSSDKKKSGSKKASIADLKALVTKYKGMIAVAKQKLAAL